MGAIPIVTFLVVAVALGFWASVFAIYFAAIGTTPLEFFLGRYEMPPDLGTWKDAGVDAARGLAREERFLLPDGRAKANYLLWQLRYRDPVTGAIVRVDPEQKVARRRVGRAGRTDE